MGTLLIPDTTPVEGTTITTLKWIPRERECQQASEDLAAVGLWRVLVYSTPQTGKVDWAQRLRGSYSGSLSLGTDVALFTVMGQTVSC